MFEEGREVETFFKVLNKAATPLVEPGEPSLEEEGDNCEDEVEESEDEVTEA
jgi:hypothetical protein